MKFLLDTHFVLWIPVDDRHINRQARTLLRSPENQFVFSASSLWEIAIKRSLQRGYFLFDPREIRRQMVENGYEELPVLGATCSCSRHSSSDTQRSPSTAS